MEESIINEPRNKYYKRYHRYYKKPDQQQFTDEFNERYQRYGENGRYNQPQSYYKENSRFEENEREYRVPQNSRAHFRNGRRQNFPEQNRRSGSDQRSREPYNQLDELSDYDREGIPHNERFQYNYPQSFTETNERYPINRKFRSRSNGMQEPVAFYHSGVIPYNAMHPELKSRERHFDFEEDEERFFRGHYNFGNDHHQKYYDEKNRYPENYYYEEARERYNRPVKKSKKRDLRYSRMF
jgi:hypothetical protein